MTDASRPVDAARIREVLAAIGADPDIQQPGNGLPAPDDWIATISLPAGIIRKADALLRDLDAQGLAPAGWLTRVEQAAWWCCDTSCGPRDKPCANCIDRVNAILEVVVSGEQPIQTAAPASPSPALHAPTVEALQTIRDALAYARLTFKDHNEPLDRIEKAQAVLRALTSGAEAGERVLTHPLTGDAVHVSTQSGRITGVEPMPKCQHGNPVNARCPECAKSGMPSMTWEPPDRGASAEPINGKRLSEWSDADLARAVDEHPVNRISVYSQELERRRASAERPLSEWSDDELFRTVCDAKGWMVSPNATPEARELRSRGWRPHHGSDKAPVEGEVHVRLRNGDEDGRIDPSYLRWSHSTPGHVNYPFDIIAFRPVRAKAKHAYFDRDDHMGGPCHFCGEERKHPNHDWELNDDAVGQNVLLHATVLEAPGEEGFLRVSVSMNNSTNREHYVRFETHLSQVIVPEIASASPPQPDALKLAEEAIADHLNRQPPSDDLWVRGWRAGVTACAEALAAIRAAREGAAQHSAAPEEEHTHG